MNRSDNELTVYLPGKAFPSVSVTGTGCDLMCEHCKGRHLKGMVAVRDAEDLVRTVDGIVSAGGTGMLVSGGCDADGSVPVMKVIDAIRYAKSKGLKVNVHTGFVGRDDAERLVKAGTDSFSVDVHQDAAVIKNILHLNIPQSAYSDMLANIISAGGVPAAHLTVGFGTEDLVMSAELVKRTGLKDVILLALVPTEGTVTEDSLISEDAVIDAVKILTEMGLNVTLGCMRPRAHRNLEIRCIDAGVRKIANPSRGTVSWARSKGMTVIEKRMCCSVTP